LPGHEKENNIGFPRRFPLPCARASSSQRKEDSLLA
jgi:hypothetical protein